MSIRDLRGMGLLKPESQWEDELPRSSVSGTYAVFWAALAFGGSGLMVFGDGGGWTWVGLAAFAAALGGFVRLNIRSVRGHGLGAHPTRNESVD